MGSLEIKEENKETNMEKKETKEKIKHLRGKTQVILTNLNSELLHKPPSPAQRIKGIGFTSLDYTVKHSAILSPSINRQQSIHNRQVLLQPKVVRKLCPKLEDLMQDLNLDIETRYKPTAADRSTIYKTFNYCVPIAIKTRRNFPLMEQQFKFPSQIVTTFDSPKSQKSYNSIDVLKNQFCSGRER